MLYSDLTKARPGYGFIGEEGGIAKATTRATPGSSIRSTAHEFPARHSAIRDLDRIAARGRDDRRLIYNPAMTTSTSPNAARAPTSTISGCASPAAQPQ